jgi:hypothetical protein
VSWTREASRHRQPAAQSIVSNSVGAADTGHRLATSLLNQLVFIPTRLSTFHHPDEHIKTEPVAWYRTRNSSKCASQEEQQDSIKLQHSYTNRKRRQGHSRATYSNAKERASSIEQHEATARRIKEGVRHRLRCYSKTTLQTRAHARPGTRYLIHLDRRTIE